MDSYLVTAAWFVAGGVVTALFSGSLAALTTRASLATVLTVGMLVPSFTWIVQLIASAIAMGEPQRRAYWRDLGLTCFVGSAVLLPAALVNLLFPFPPRWFSVVNVLLSVVLMAVYLVRRTRQHGLAIGWPIGWCLTICVNMALFLWSSWSWW